MPGNEEPTTLYALLTPRDNLNVFVDAQANALLLDPSNPGVVYVGTDTGVLRSLDNGARWTAIEPVSPRRISALQNRRFARRASCVAPSCPRGCWRRWRLSR